MQSAMQLMSPDVCSLVLMQARARSDKQGVTSLSKREELPLLWLLRRYVWQITRQHAQADVTKRSPHNQFSSNFFADTRSYKILTKHQTSKSIMTVKWTVIWKSLLFCGATMQFTYLHPLPLLIWSLPPPHFLPCYAYHRKTISTLSMLTSLYYTQKKRLSVMRSPRPSVHNADSSP